MRAAAQLMWKLTERDRCRFRVGARGWRLFAPTGTVVARADVARLSELREEVLQLLLPHARPRKDRGNYVIH
jgi:hypothetical protein